MNLTKKLALAVVAFGISSAAFAGSYSAPACTSHAVTIPCADSAWGVSFEVFWAQATANDQLYAVSGNATSSVFDFAQVDPDYKFGFELAGAFQFSTGNDLTVRWTRAHSHNNDAFKAGTDTTIQSDLRVGSSAFFAENMVAATDSNVVAKHNYEFDSIALELGQHIDVGSDMDLRVHAGLQYARVDYDKSVRFTADSAEHSFNFDSEFDGVGARVGADGAYNLGNGYSAVAHVALSLLAGEIESQSRAFQAGANTGLALKEEVNFNSDVVVVPAGSLKAGLNYASDMFDGHMSLEGGWRWDGYFNSMRFSPAFGADFENFTFSGPYLAVSYVS